MDVAEALAEAERVIGASVRLDDRAMVSIPKEVLVALYVGAQMAEDAQLGKGDDR